MSKSLDPIVTELADALERFVEKSPTIAKQSPTIMRNPFGLSVSLRLVTPPRVSLFQMHEVAAFRGEEVVLIYTKERVVWVSTKHVGEFIPRVREIASKHGYTVKS